MAEWAGIWISWIARFSLLAGAVFFARSCLLAKAEKPDIDVRSYCLNEFQSKLLSRSSNFASLCSKLALEDICVSEKSFPIPHYQKEGTAKVPVRILVFGQIHGDEYDAGILAMKWIERLESLDPKNTWRIVPRLNPDGFHLKQRMNARGVDLNRNFPTRDWGELALHYWKSKEKSNPRRYPGPGSASEAETRCAIRQIDEFKPDVVVSIHSPYGLLDLDGESSKRMPFFGLPWRNLGTFPGSLGRYLWNERHVPVLTIELAPSSLAKSGGGFDRLQDFISLLARHSAANE